MAQLTVDVSMLEALMQEGGSPSPRGQPSCPRAWAMPMVTDGDLTGEVGWGAVGVAPPVAAAVPASVRVLQQARAIATESEGFRPELPVTVVGMDLVQAARQGRFEPGVPMATIVESLAAAPSTEGVPVCAGLVQTAQGGPSRSVQKDRRLLKLASKWRCAFCKAFGARVSRKQATGLRER
jgi:hypothetical protein